jgi:AcrR family transcriptional regulator
VTAPVATVPEAAARGGRPRDPSRDAVLVEAALELLGEGGYAGLTMEAVAARAGVGKATLYRRWPSKEQLVVDALATLTEPTERVEHAGVRDQLVGLLDAVRRRAGSRAGQIFPRLIGDAVDNPELMRRYREQVLEPRRRRFIAVLEQGVAEGLVRPDVDLEHASTCSSGRWPTATSSATTRHPGPRSPRASSTTSCARWRRSCARGTPPQRPFAEKCW